MNVHQINFTVRPVFGGPLRTQIRKYVLYFKIKIKCNFQSHKIYEAYIRLQLCTYLPMFYYPSFIRFLPIHLLGGVVMVMCVTPPEHAPRVAKHGLSKKNILFFFVDNFAIRCLTHICPPSPISVHFKFWEVLKHGYVY